MKVPVRVYNHVLGRVSTLHPTVLNLTSSALIVDTRPRPYDILWPVARRRAPPPSATVVEKASVSKTLRLPRTNGTSSGTSTPFFDVGLADYAAQLLTTVVAARSVDDSEPPSSVRSSSIDTERSTNQTTGPEDDADADGAIGSREAVEILTRNLKKGWTR
jgi:RAB6A-GEF complex partner protein 2